jgi:hypothetical protein
VWSNMTLRHFIVSKYLTRPASRTKTAASLWFSAPAGGVMPKGKNEKYIALCI